MDCPYYTPIIINLGVDARSGDTRGVYMQCTHPVYLKSVKMKVPCGRCIHCKIQKTREWTLRCYHESLYHPFNSFVTLTYADSVYESYCDKSVSKDDLSRYIKNLRRKLAPIRFKYFACGEYGKKFGRCHYHLILFGIPHDTPAIVNTWKDGLVDSRPLIFERIKYICGYVRKKLDGERSGGRDPAFQLSSTKLGLKWFEDNFEYLSKYLSCRIEGVDFGLPKYYKLKLLERDPSLLSRFEELASIKNEDYIKRMRNVIPNYFEIDGLPFGCKNLQEHPRLHLAWAHADNVAKFNDSITKRKFDMYDSDF